MLNDYSVRSEIETEIQDEPGLDADDVHVSVRDGVAMVMGHVVTLTGEVDWEFQKALIERTVRRQSDVIGIANLIKVRRRTVVGAIQDGLMTARRQIAEVESRCVSIKADDGKGTLSAQVKAARARRRAAKAAWSTPRVAQLANQ